MANGIGPVVPGQSEDDPQIRLAAAMAGIPIEQARLQAKMRRAQGLMDAPSAQGRQVGQTFVAASPFEHLATAMQRIQGGRQMQEAEQAFQPLAQQARDAAQASAAERNALAPPEWGAPAGVRRSEAVAGGWLKKPAPVVQRPNDLPAPPDWNALPGMTQGQAISAGYAKKPEPKAPGGMSGHGGMGVAPSNDIEAIADAIVSGKQPPSLSELRSNTAPVRAALARKNYDLTSATADWAATQKHIATLNGPQQERLRQAVYTVDHSLDTLDDLYSQWQRVGPASGFKVFNRAALAAARNAPGEAGAVAQALEAQINDLTAELGQVYMGGNSPTDHALKLAGQNLKSDWNEQTFRKMIGLARTNLAIRKNSMANSMPVGTGGNSYAQQPPGAPDAAATPDASAALRSKYGL